MQRQIICGGLALSIGGAALAQPVRPAITSVSHLAVYTSDPAKAEGFYVHDLGAAKRPDPENPAGTRYHFSPLQFVEVLPLPSGSGINRLDHTAFNVSDAEGTPLSDVQRRGGAAQTQPGRR